MLHELMALVGARTGVRLFVVIVALLLQVHDVDAKDRAFSVDAMMKLEGIGEVRFSPLGNQLMFEQVDAYESSRNFAWDRVWDRERMKLMSADLTPGGSVLGLGSLSGEGRAWMGSYSPSGEMMAIGWFDGDVAKAGVYDFRTRELRKFDVRVSNAGIESCAFDCPFWISEDEFVLYSISQEQQKSEMSFITYTDERTSAWAKRSWAGREPAVRVSGSGAFQSTAVEGGGTLLKVDAKSGKFIELGSGRYFQLSQSPDGRRIAAVREVGNLPIVNSSARAIIGADKVLKLVIYDFTDQQLKAVDPCEACNVTRGTLRWSPSGSKLFFSARVDKAGELLHENYIYDLASARLDRFAPQGVALEVDENPRNASYVAPFVWLTDDVPAIRVARKNPAGKNGRYDWYAVPLGGFPVMLTRGVQNAHAALDDYVAAHDGALLLMVDGSLWKFRADGAATEITAEFDEVRPWCSVVAYWRSHGASPVCSGTRLGIDIVRDVDKDALSQGWVTLRVLQDGVDTGDLLFANIESGQIVRVSSPNPGAELMAASALAQAAVYRTKEADGDHLLLVSPRAGKQELLHFNRHLAGVAKSKLVMLARREPGENEDRYDWLLLPPFSREGERHPLLVYFYPDKKYSKDWRNDDLRLVSFINQNIPAAHGFAVLLASMKISGMGERGEPMTEMHEQLIRAAENAVKKGYADADRWAIMGHSYGGYGTNSVITQTDRFRAAIAIAGPVNLTSSYARGISARKAINVSQGLSAGVLWSEGGQGRMGAPPWQAPERYIRNSPLFHADKIVTPLLLVHGDYDIVDASEAEQMFNALHRQGKDVQFLRYWGEGHSIRSPANIRDMWSRIFQWLDYHLNIARDRQI